MRTVRRPRRYVGRNLFALLRPAFRYSQSREAYVLRAIGAHTGPVLRVDRRTAHRSSFDGVERRTSVA